jgi:hypothetical protein
MNPESRSNHRLYLQVLRKMTSDQRLAKAFELSATAKKLFIEGLREQFPSTTEEGFRGILRARLEEMSQSERRIGFHWVTRNN